MGTLLKTIGGIIFLTMLALQPSRATENEIEATSIEAVAAAWRSYQPAFEPRACWFGDVAEAEAVDIVCGVVKVPEDRTDPQSALISIAVMTVNADRHRSSSGPLVWLDSGPGFSSISKARAESAIAGRLEPLRRATGLVFFDQRGTGESGRNFCRSVPDAFTYGVRVEPEGEAIFARNMRRCLDRARARGIPVSAYSSWHIALDVRDIRMALGFDRWNLLGYLTSTGIAQAVMQVDPEGVRAAVLDSPGPTKLGYSDAPSLAMDATLRRLSALCNAEPTCKARNGDLHARVLAILDSYERRPLTITGLNPEAATAGRLIFDDRIAGNYLMFMLYSSKVHRDLPAILDVLEDRDRDAIRVYAENWFQPPDGKSSQAVRFAIKCRNESGGLGTPPETLVAAQAQAPEIYRRLGLFRYADDCAALDYGGPDPTDNWTQFAGPVLITDGALNPVQRPRISKLVAAQFPAGKYVVFAHGGVMPIISQPGGCGARIMMEFLANPDRPVDAECAANDPAPQFITSYRRTSKPGLLLMNIQSGNYPMALGMLLFGILVAVIVVPASWLARKWRPAARASGPAVPRTELIGYSAILLSVSAFALFTFILMEWVEQHPAAVPAGVPSSTIWSLALAGLASVLAILSLVLALRNRHRSSKLSLAIVFCCSLAALATLLWIWSMI